MICREIFADVLAENKRLLNQVPGDIWRDIVFSAWNDYNSEVKQAWSRFPPRDAPGGTKVEFTPEYERAISVALLKKNARIHALFMLTCKDNTNG